MSEPTDRRSGLPSATLARDPVPRREPLTYRSIAWPAVRRIALPQGVPPPPADFASVLEQRRSSRTIVRAPLREVANFLSFSTAPSSSWGTAPPRTRAPSHSAGALHPVNVLIVAGAKIRRVFRMDPMAAGLELLRVDRRQPLDELCAKIGEMFPHAHCDYIVLLADCALVESRYLDGDTLVWRDAGALMQTLHLCATAYRLAFCPAGILGSQLADALLGPDSRFQAVGAAIVGRLAVA